MSMPKPGPGHEKLKTMTGVWVGEENMYPSQWDPAGGMATGRTNSRLALGGFAVIGDYEQERDGVITFAGHSVTTFDPKEELYTLYWFDSIGSPPEVFSGLFDGDVLRMSHGGPGMHVRMTSDYSEPGQLRSKMEMSTDGQDWKTLFDGHYQRNKEE